MPVLLPLGSFTWSVEVVTEKTKKRQRDISLMKPKRLKVYVRLGLISTKLPIVKNLIEIIMYIQMYQNNMKMVLETHVKPFATCKAP